MPPVYTGMTWAEMKVEVQAIVRRPLAADDTLATAMLGRLVNRAIRWIQRRHEFRAMREEFTDLATVAGERLVALPVRYKAFTAAGPEVYKRSAAGVLTRLYSTVRVTGDRSGELAVTPDWLRQKYPDPAERAEPTMVCVDGEYLHLGPIPDAIYNLTVECLAYSLPLDGTTTRNWFSEHLERAVIQVAVALGLEDLGEGAEAQEHFALAQGEIEDQLHVESEERRRRTGPRAAVVRGGYA